MADNAQQDQLQDSAAPDGVDAAPDVRAFVSEQTEELEPPEMPEYELTSYEPVEITMPHLDVSDELVEKQMRDIAESQSANYVPTGRKVVGPDDTVSLDLWITDPNGEALSQLSGQNQLISMEEGSMPPDFLAKVRETPVGADNEFDFTAPSFENPGEEDTFHAAITLRAIMEKDVPDITDEWTAVHTPMTPTVAKLRKRVRGELLKHAAEMTEGQRSALIMQELSERFEGKIDDYFYELQRDAILQDMSMQARSQRMTLQDFVKRQGMDENQFSMMVMMQARGQLVQGFCLDAWARHFELEPTEEDRKQVARTLAPGHESELLEQIDADERKKEDFDRTARRFVAGRDVARRARVKYEGRVDLGQVMAQASAQAARAGQGMPPMPGMM